MKLTLQLSANIDGMIHTRNYSYADIDSIENMKEVVHRDILEMKKMVIEASNKHNGNKINNEVE